MKYKYGLDLFFLYIEFISKIVLFAVVNYELGSEGTKILT